MELKYPINKNTGAQNRFFRGQESIFDLLAESKLPFKKWIEPIYNNHPDFDIELDEQESCNESCEPFPIEDGYKKVPKDIAMQYLKTGNDALISPYLKTIK